MASPQWFRRRERWLQEYRAREGADPVCVVCGCEWTLRSGDLHHRSYRRLGLEDWRDLMPLCRTHHHAMHAFLEADPAWWRLGPPQASDLIAAKLRDRYRRGAQR
jgi:5-methylcytosine-specific restriction endonuclease McrA